MIGLTPVADHFAAMARICKGQPPKRDLAKALLGSGILIHRQARWWCATARHVLEDAAEEEIRVLYSPDGTELSYFCPVGGVYPDPDGRDVAVLELAPASDSVSPPSTQPEFGVGGLVFGQTVWLLGYPRVSSPLGTEYPLDTHHYPVVKAGPLSYVRLRASSEDDSTLLLVGTQGNRGYSGGAVALVDYEGKQKIAGIVIGTSAESKDRRLHGDADLTPVKEDAGFTWAVGIEHALDIIDGLHTKRGVIRTAAKTRL